MRLLAAALAGFALAAVPALAATHRVTNTGDTAWTPATVTVAPGDTVVWRNSGGFHNVRFSDFEEPADPSAGGWEAERTFTAAGTYDYVCEAHPEMRGRVVVKAAETAPAVTDTSAPQPQAPATAQTPPPPPSSAPVVTPSVTIRALAPVRRGVRLRITSDRARTLTGTLRRRNRSYGKLRLKVRRGTRIHRVVRTHGGRRLARGRYELTLRSAGAYGLPVTVRFRVR